MQLTRRDATAALAALGVTGGIALGSGRLREESEQTSYSREPSVEDVQAVMTAVAEVVYPSEVEGVADFVEAFLDGRFSDPDHAAAVRKAVTELDEIARTWYGSPVAELGPGTRDQFLREAGVHTAEEDPEGTTPERVRYYVVNDLLLALYASPTGGELVGIENPQGHPGGTDSYTQGPR